MSEENKITFGELELRFGNLPLKDNKLSKGELVGLWIENQGGRIKC